METLEYRATPPEKDDSEKPEIPLPLPETDLAIIKITDEPKKPDGPPPAPGAFDPKAWYFPKNKIPPRPGSERAN